MAALKHCEEGKCGIHQEPDKIAFSINFYVSAFRLWDMFKGWIKNLNLVQLAQFSMKRSPKSLRHNVYKRCFKVYKRYLSQKLTLHILLEFKVLVNLGVNILKKKFFFVKLNKDYVTAFLKTIFFTLEKKSSILVNPYTTFTLGKSYLINRFFKFL